MLLQWSVKPFSLQTLPKPPFSIGELGGAHRRKGQRLNLWFSLISCRNIHMCKAFWKFAHLVTRKNLCKHLVLCLFSQGFLFVCFSSGAGISQQLLWSVHPPETGFSRPVTALRGFLAETEKPLVMCSASRLDVSVTLGSVLCRSPVISGLQNSHFHTIHTS